MTEGVDPRSLFKKFTQEIHSRNLRVVRGLQKLPYRKLNAFYYAYTNVAASFAKTGLNRLELSRKLVPFSIKFIPESLTIYCKRKPKMKMSWALLGAALSIYSLNAMALDTKYTAWTAVLTQYQNESGQIRYGALKKDTETKGHNFTSFLDEIAKVGSTQYKELSRNDKMAFLINSYNALTIKLILDNYPTKSIKSIGGFFKKPWDIEFFSLLDGKLKSLDPIEHKFLRPVFKDYRVHAAVNCASVSCPNLRHEAFVADRLDSQLDEQMRLWLADNTKNNFGGDQKIEISKIFDWYKDDFTQSGGGVLEVLKKYAPDNVKEKLAKNPSISYLDYNWNLNESK